jgi:hypothetical protein
MRPTLVPGDRLYVDPRPSRELGRGDLVVVRDPERPDRSLVKRVGAMAGDATDLGRTLPEGTVFLVGDNAMASRDSRQFGPVDRQQVLGVVWFRYAPPHRRGPLGGTFK